MIAQKPRKIARHAACGRAVKAGASLAFTLLTYRSDSTQSVQTKAYETPAAAAGIEITIKTVPNVYAIAGRCQPSQAECSL